MKEGWKYKSLGDVCEILDSRRKPITKNKRESGTIPYYGATGILDYVKDYIFDEKLVLLGEDGAKWGAGENSAYIIEGKSWVNNHAHALRPKRDLLVDEILVYYLNFSNLLPYITGVTVPKLNQEKMRSIEIPIGPVKEQQSIVDYLDSAFAKIDAMKANAEKALNEAKALFQASLREMLEPKEGWEYKKLGEVCDFEGGSQPPKSEWINHPQNGYIRMLQIRDFTKSRNAEIEYVKITKKLRLCKDDDILIGRYGASVGKILTGLAGAYNVAIIKSIPNEELIKKDFIRRYFESPLFQSILFKVCTSRAAQAGFSKNDIKDELIPLPPLSEQQSIVETLDSLKSKVDRLQENYDKISQECDALKQAILRQVFE